VNNDITWLLVCDASSARLFSSRGRQAPLNLLREFDHPAGHATNHELTTDKPGRVQQSAGPNKGSSSAMEPHTSPKTVEQRHFAHDLADALHKGLGEGAYQHLVLVAPPHFLGLLRAVLDQQVEKQVRMSMDKDYTQLDVRELGERLAPVWQPIAAIRASA
jgi:protein required for attachment to host cells